MPIFLHQPVAGPLAELRFFNGRLLTGTDLDREQSWTVARDARLGGAVGPGIVDGLDVQLVSVSPPIVTVGGGAAIDRGGRALRLPADQPVQLTFDAAAPGATTDGSFNRCAPSTPTVAISGPGLYLLVLRGGELAEGIAPIARIDRAADPCVKERDTEVVSFELIQLAAMQQELGGDAALRRNIAAHLCFGSPGLTDAAATQASFGGRDAALTSLTACDVPLALVLADNSGIAWVDAWSVRRRPTPPNVQTAAGRATGPRVDADAEARLAQFIQHAAAIAGADAPGALRWLPPAAPIPAAWSDAQALALLGPSEPAEITPADLSLLPGLLTHSLTQGAIDRSASPPAAVDLWRAPDGQRLFARATDGRIRLVPSGVSASDLATVTITATRAGSNLARTFTLKGAAFVSPNLEPGAYTLTLTSARVRFSAAAPAPAVVGGQVTTVNAPMVLLEGSILVTVKGTNDQATIAGATVSATGPGGVTRAATWDGSRYLLAATAAGNWNVTASKSGYAANSATVTVTAGAAAPLTLWLGKTRTPPRKYQDFSLSGAPSRVTMLEPGVRTDPGFTGKGKAVFHPAQEKSQRTSFYRPSSQRDVEARELAFQSKAETWASGKATSAFTGNLVPWDAPAEVDAWLADWRDWLASTEEDLVDGRAIAKVIPQIYITRGTTVAGLVDNDSALGRPSTPEGWASFGSFWLPVAFSRTSKVVPNPGYRPNDVLELLDAYERRPGYFDDMPVEVLPWVPKDIYEIALDLPPDRLGPVQDDVKSKIDRTIGALEYVPGLTTSQRGELTTLYGSQSTPQPWMTPSLFVLLPPAQLPAISGLNWQVTIGAAQQITSPALWSVAESRLPFATELAAAGFTSMSELNGAFATPQGIGEITRLIGEAGVTSLAPAMEAAFVSTAVAAAVASPAAGSAATAGEVVAIDLSAGTTGIAGALAGAGINAGTAGITSEKVVGASTAFRDLVGGNLAGRLGTGTVTIAKSNIRGFGG